MKLSITLPIYKKDYMPRARKDALLGMNWYTANSNTFRKKGKGKVTTSTGVAQMKTIIHQLVADNKDNILAEHPGWDPNHGNGFHVSYKVYAKRLGSDGHNIRSAMEKMALDAIEAAGLIDNDKYVYSTDSKFYLNRTDPRIEIEISHLQDYDYVID